MRLCRQVEYGVDPFVTQDLAHQFGIRDVPHDGLEMRVPGHVGDPTEISSVGQKVEIDEAGLGKRADQVPDHVGTDESGTSCDEYPCGWCSELLACSIGVLLGKSVQVGSVGGLGGPRRSARPGAGRAAG